MSEASAVTHANTEREFRLGSVGKGLPGVKTKIADDGEILVSCQWVFTGYYNDEQATKEALHDGWYVMHA
jgi:long-chain acyl-CoA synthetase